MKYTPREGAQKSQQSVWQLANPRYYKFYRAFITYVGKNNEATILIVKESGTSETIVKSSIIEAKKYFKKAYVQLGMPEPEWKERLDISPISTLAQYKQTKF